MATEISKLKFLTTEEKEEVVMQYFGMKRRYELAALIRSMMKAIKNEYEIKIKNIPVFIDSTSFLDTNRMKSDMHELTTVMDRYEYMSQLYDAVNAHIEHPDALP